MGDKRFNNSKRMNAPIRDSQGPNARALAYTPKEILRYNAPTIQPQKKKKNGPRFNLKPFEISEFCLNGGHCRD